MAIEEGDLRRRIDARVGLGVPLLTVEKDYAIGYFLAGVARLEALAPLHFKGGTLLRKVYFAD